MHVQAELTAICFHNVANWPVSNISTLSPGESVLTMAGFPRSGAGGGEDHHLARGLENRLEILQKLQREPAELGPAVIDGGPRDGAQNTVRNVAGSGNLKEVTSACVWPW